MRTYSGAQGTLLIAHLLLWFSCSVMFDSLVTPWTVAHQASLSMGFSRQEYWSGLPFPPPGGFTDPGIKPEFPVAPALQADSLLLGPPRKPSKSDSSPCNCGRT